MPLREVRLSADYSVSDYADFQENYLHFRGGRRLYPSSKIYIGDELVIETNSLGCFGAEPDLTKPVIGVFGDSVVQGAHGGFVIHIDLPDFSVVNGGIEGATLDEIVNQALRVHAVQPMAYAVVHPGFHNLIYGDTTFIFWENQLQRLKQMGIPVALLRLTTDVHPEAVKRGYSHLFGPDYFRTQHSKDDLMVKTFQEAVDKKNKLMERLAERLGFAMIDLDPLLAPKSYDEVTTRFFDVIHPRKEMYPQIGAVLTQKLGALTGAVPAAAPAPAAPAAQITAQEALKDRGRNYPLW